MTSPILNIPNALTLLRIAAIPAILIALDAGRAGLALGLFVGAGLTDALDGGIARLTNTRTDLGAHLDPLADKGLVLTLLVKLTVLGLVPGWILTIVLTRDVTCLTGYAVLYFLTGEGMEVRPSLVGKLATVLQLAGVASGLLGLANPDLSATLPTVAILSLAAAVTAITGVQYVIRGLRWYQAHPV